MKRVERWAIVNDVHFPNVHRPTWNAFRLWLADEKPEHLLFNGDFLDLEQLSRYEPDPAAEVHVLPAIKEWIDEVWELAPFVEHMHVLEGNHEQRFYKQVIQPVAQKLHGFVGLTLEDQCRAQGLPEPVEWRSVSKSYIGYQIGNVLVRHGHEMAGGPYGGGKHVAANLIAKSMGRSEVNGHWHRCQLYAHGTSDRGVIYGLCVPYMEAGVNYAPDPAWVRGFAVLEHDTVTGRVTPYPVIVDDGRFSYAGKLYDGNVNAVISAKQPAKAAKKASLELEWQGRKYSADALGREVGIPGNVIRNRLRAGYSLEEALSVPVAPRGIEGKGWVERHLATKH